MERFWSRYRFEGTPLTLFVGAELKAVSQAGIYGNDDPGIGVELEFGNLQLSAKAYIERESQRLGLENDNDLVDYAFTAVYNPRPHRFGVDVVYFRDRFAGADTAVTGFRSGLGWTGQKIDSVWIDASWSGRFGPIRALLQGNALVGTARGSTVRGAGATGLPATVFQNVDYDIFAGGGLAYLEVDLGIVRPFIGAVYGTGDGDPTDRRLQGFQVQPVNDSTQVTSTGFFDQLDTSSTFALRDYSCPARSQGQQPAAQRAGGVPGNPYAVGTNVLGNVGGSTECSHSTSNVFNSRLGNSSHSGIVTNYSNPGTLVVPVGLKVFPLRGHELAGSACTGPWSRPTCWRSPLPPNWRAARGGFARRSTTVSGATGSGLSIRTSTFVCRGRLPFQAMATKTSRACRTAIPVQRSAVLCWQ